MNFKGSIKLADIDLPRIGAEIGVGEDEIHAFLEVETSGGGWDAQGRLKMLFEPHIFYRHLTGAARQLAVKQGLAYPTQGTKPYPRDSYPRLMLALKIAGEAALESASWGIGQVMGFNHAAAGYRDVFQMVSNFVEFGEPAQLRAAIQFIKHEHLDDELRARNWPAFARGYNGANYAKNKYDVKLAAAYKKWASIKDTPYDPDHSVA